MFYRFKLKKILPCPKIDKYNRFLFVGAHGCDIEKGAGATVSKLTGEGKEVKFVITTNSTDMVKIKGLTDENKLLEIRQKEALCSASILGVKEVEFLPISSFTENSIDNFFVELLKIVVNYKPDVIFVSDTFVPNEINSDDYFTSKAIEKVFLVCKNERLANKFGVEHVNVKAIAYYNSIMKNYYVQTIGFGDTKLQAIMAHSSILPERASDKFATMRSYKYLIKADMYHDGLKSFKIKAEGFRVVTYNGTHNMSQINFI